MFFTCEKNINFAHVRMYVQNLYKVKKNITFWYFSFRRSLGRSLYLDIYTLRTAMFLSSSKRFLLFSKLLVKQQVIQLSLRFSMILYIFLTVTFFLKRKFKTQLSFEKFLLIRNILFYHVIDYIFYFPSIEKFEILTIQK